MPLVLAAGPSITDYPANEVMAMAANAFTFAVNATCFQFPCDVVVSVDPAFIVKYAKELKRLGKPIVCREYPVNKDYDLDIIELGNAIIDKYPLSGMLACKIADRMAQDADCRLSYVLGMDASVGHYKGHLEPNNTNYVDEVRTLDKYEAMGLTHTINLSVHSKIKCWPKISKLPNWKKYVVDGKYRAMALTWLRVKAQSGDFV